MQVELTQDEINLMTQLMSQVPALAPAAKLVIALNDKIKAAQEAEKPAEPAKA